VRYWSLLKTVSRKAHREMFGLSPEEEMSLTGMNRMDWMQIFAVPANWILVLREGHEVAYGCSQF